MRKESTKALIKLLAALIIIFSTSNSNAQDDAINHEKPYMWSKNKPRMIKHFINRKLRLLSEATGKSQPSSFKLGNFLGMVKYFKDTYDKDFECLHVYIAMFSAEGLEVPKGHGNELTLIFSPAKKTETDPKYFIIPPDKPFDEKKPGDFKIDKKLAMAWRDNYIKAAESIKKTINKNNPYNEIKPGEVSDTRSITYCSKHLLELVAEQGYTHADRSNNKIDLSKDIQASFAAFGSKGNPRHEKKGKKRIFVEFGFLGSDGKLIYLEDTKDFRERVPKGRKPRKEKCMICQPDRPGNKDIDNGQLCPPSSNCPDN